MWSILCQLVPFAQVVLLTINEYLREDEKVSFENDEIQPTTPGITLEDESNPKEAWMSSLRELLKAGSITMITMIGGKILTKFKILFSGSLFREKSGATDCAFCHNCLLCNCCKFLFSIMVVLIFSKQALQDFLLSWTAQNVTLS